MSKQYSMGWVLGGRVGHSVLSLMNLDQAGTMGEGKRREGVRVRKEHISLGKTNASPSQPDAPIPEMFLLLLLPHCYSGAPSLKL